VSVCAHSVYSINRLCTGRWSPWLHRCTACCSKSILPFLRDITVTFLYISPKTPLRSWTRLYHQKANKTTFPTISCMEKYYQRFIRVEYISRRTIRHSAHSNEWGRIQSSLQQCASLPQRISHLADICTLWAPPSSFNRSAELQNWKVGHVQIQTGPEVQKVASAAHTFWAEILSSPLVVSISSVTFTRRGFVYTELDVWWILPE